MSDDMKPCPFCGDKTPAARIRAALQPGKEVMPLGPEQTENLRRPVDTSPGVTAGATAALVEAVEPFKKMAAEMFARNWNKKDVAIALDNPDDPHRLTFADFLALHAARQGGYA